MTDGGHVPNEGLPEHLLGGAEVLGRPEGVAVPGVAVPGAAVPGVPSAEAGMPGGPMTGVPMAGGHMLSATVPAQGGEGWAAEHRPAYTFLDQPDQEDDDDVLLMPGPQGSWGESVVHGPVETVLVADPTAADAQPGSVAVADTMALRTVDENVLASLPEQAVGTPVEPSWPPVAPPVAGVGEMIEEPMGQGVQDAAAGVPVAQAVPGQPVAPQAATAMPTAAVPAPTMPVGAVQAPPVAAPPTAPQPQRRPLHAGPPIPDPSLMTGQVPVRSLADRGPSGQLDPQAFGARPAPQGSTPAHGVPVFVPPVAAEVPVAPVQVPVQVQPEAQPAAVEQVVVEPVVAEPVAEAPSVEAPAEAAVVAPIEAAPVETAAVEAAPEEAQPVAPVVAVAAGTLVAEAVAVEAQPVEAVSAEAAPAAEAPAAEAPVAELPAADVPAADAPTTDAPTTDVPTAAVPTAEDSAVEVQPADVQPGEARPAEDLGAEGAAVFASTDAQPVDVVAAEAAEAQESPAVEAQPVEAPAAEAEAVAPEATEEAPSAVVEAPSAEAASPEPAAAEEPSGEAVPTEAPAVENEPAEAPQAVVPPQPSAPSPPRRIAAFLADPAPHGLPTVEAEQLPEAAAEAGQLTDQTVGQAAEPAAQSVPEVTSEPVPETVAGTGDVPSVQAVEAQPEPQPASEPQAEPSTEGQGQTQAGQDSAGPEPEPEAAEPEVAESEVAESEVAESEVAEPVDRGPAAPGYDELGRDAVHQVIRERRDIRNGFRPDPIPHEVLIRVLEAAHTAPSVGYSQPWDFVVIRSAKTRQKMHALAERQRDAYAESLPKGRAKQFKEIKIEAILETPVNIVVTADRTRGGRHTLGRHTQPQMAPYSAALAVENLWLAARAEGLGVGWVSFFDEEEMVRELGLPEHLDVVAYLCVGYVDSFPDEPELQQQGWAKKRPLSWVVHEEQYGNRALPGEEPHSLLSETLRGIRPLDAKALGEAWDRQKRMTKPAGSLGLLEIIAAQLSGLSRKCPPPIPEPGCVAIFAGDHGVHAQGVTPWPQEVTAQMVSNFLAGGAVVNAFAAQVGAEVCVVDVGVKSELPEAIQQGRTTGLLPRKVKPGTDDMTQGPAMSREEALKAIEVGIETARDLVAAGNKVLITGDMGIANTTASAALISVFTGSDPAEVTGRGTGIDDATHSHKVEVIRQALALHQPDAADPIGVLSAVGGLEHAAIAGFLLGAASLRTPVILDGVIAGSAALVAKAIAPEVLAACIAGHRSAEPGHQAALAKLGLRPLIDLDLRLGEGTGALLALPLVQSAARAMHDVATFDSAGVTEKE
ncbi:nicotinate-nucleotide--dimethylbenzimidazole phosphoribosyltransferase [Kitasatospora sp. GP82]|uniref:nicotinate-nucleotide--dimethylbenzimidazole phosphoribosyltransferase n=1 Tax=Kitasatospora sp. GP82 TaxID=3035089 RepID=UPI0024743D8C|nr:nicotinate-nucleotide--dimethylbenzimidazole phosphoribosyltransferase [Kitasatospora sp. GP82]MDH6126983.1 nicotinate-nucleotide--dimethylbenzimidazole phosphoribosyltransferase [Kitasatospora sp. GP82]